MCVSFNAAFNAIIIRNVYIARLLVRSLRSLEGNP